MALGGVMGVGGVYGAWQIPAVQDMLIAEAQQQLIGEPAAQPPGTPPPAQPTSEWQTENLDIQNFKLVRMPDGTMGFKANGRQRETGASFEASCSAKACVIKRAPTP